MIYNEWKVVVIWPDNNEETFCTELTLVVVCKTRTISYHEWRLLRYGKEFTEWPLFIFSKWDNRYKWFQPVNREVIDQPAKLISLSVYLMDIQVLNHKIMITFLDTNNVLISLFIPPHCHRVLQNFIITLIVSIVIVKHELIFAIVQLGKWTCRKENSSLNQTFLFYVYDLTSNRTQSINMNWFWLSN